MPSHANLALIGPLGLPELIVLALTIGGPLVAAFFIYKSLRQTRN